MDAHRSLGAPTHTIPKLLIVRVTRLRWSAYKWQSTCVKKGILPLEEL
jgi:hypothetical protein